MMNLFSTKATLTLSLQLTFNNLICILLSFDSWSRPLLHLVTAPDQVNTGTYHMHPGTDPEHCPPLGDIRVVCQQ